MFKVLALFVILPPAIIGGFLLFSPVERLFAGVSWTRLPMPTKGTGLYKLLVAFWRAIGVAALLFALFVAYMVFIRGA